MGDQASLWQLDSARRLADLEARRKRFVSVLEALDTVPRRRTVAGMLPFGPRAIVPGRLVHTNEVMVLLGDNYFAEVSAAEAADIAARRLVRIDQQILELAGSREEIKVDPVQDTSEDVSNQTEPSRAAGESEQAKPSVASPVKRRSYPNAAVGSMPRDPTDRADVLRQLAENLEAGAKDLHNEQGQRVVLLEEEYEDSSNLPVRIRGLPNGTEQDPDSGPGQDADSEDSGDEVIVMRSLEEEMAMLAELADAEERLIAAEKEARKTPKRGIKKGFLLPSTDTDTSASIAPTKTSADIDSPPREQSRSPVMSNTPIGDDVVRTKSPKKVTFGPDQILTPDAAVAEAAQERRRRRGAPSGSGAAFRTEVLESPPAQFAAEDPSAGSETAFRSEILESAPAQFGVADSSAGSEAAFRSEILGSAPAQFGATNSSAGSEVAFRSEILESTPVLPVGRMPASAIDAAWEPPEESTTSNDKAPTQRRKSIFKQRREDRGR